MFGGGAEVSDPGDPAGRRWSRRGGGAHAGSNATPGASSNRCSASPTPRSATSRWRRCSRSCSERIRGGLQADTAAILLLDEDRGVLVARAARGLEEEVRQGVQVPLARGFAGRVAASRQPIVIEDLNHADVVNPILRQKGIRSMLGVPVHVEGRVIGVMHVGTLERRLFDEDDIALLQLAADRAALAIDTRAPDRAALGHRDHAARAAARRAADGAGAALQRQVPAGRHRRPDRRRLVRRLPAPERAARVRDRGRRRARACWRRR